MKLFLKIFLWFLAALALMFFVIVFVTRVFQVQPTVSRWERSAKNQLTFYKHATEQIEAGTGDEGVNEFLTRLKAYGYINDVALYDDKGNALFGTVVDHYSEATAKARESGEAAVIDRENEATFGAVPLTLKNGRTGFLIIQWEQMRIPPLFFDSWVGMLRLAGLLISAILFCALLAAYLTSPIRKLRRAAQRLAAGELNTRVKPQLPRRRDELADLARDFDEMAERIESLITSQERLTRDVSHELRSPLARMNVALELAKQRSGPELQPLLSRIEGESERLNEMISRILTLSKLESGAFDEFRGESLDLTEVVREVAADADFEAKAKGKAVDLVWSDECTIVGNENLLRSAIENVVRNAVKYTDDGTTVRVSVIADNGNAKIQIGDRGGGVPESELTNLFIPFYRLGAARDRKSGGTGLGLAIARRAVMAHKGQISARNVSGGLEVEIVLNRTNNGETAGH
ncbi:MAG TPA: ATP-binding protein [Pyrinomonadaceae bacterium]|nr:ATP-binding protein [Pyrinomonadaceae bacterium]